MSIEERIDAVMNMNGADIENVNSKVKDIQAKLDSANAKLDEFEQQRQNSLSAEEKMQEAMAKIAEQRRELAMKSNRVDAKAVLKGAGLTDEEVDKQLSLIVTEDADVTMSGANAIADLVKSQRKLAKAEAEQAMLKDMGKPGGATGGNPVTKDDFAKMTYSKKLELKQSDPDLYKTLMSS